MLDFVDKRKSIIAFWYQIITKYATGVPNKIANKIFAQIIILFTHKYSLLNIKCLEFFAHEALLISKYLVIIFSIRIAADSLFIQITLFARL